MTLAINQYLSKETYFVTENTSVSLYAKDGSVWMNQNQLAELFDTSKPNISMHISNILKEGELGRESVGAVSSPNQRGPATKMFEINNHLCIVNLWYPKIKHLNSLFLKH